MVAVSRFVEFSVNAQTFATGSSTDSGGAAFGTRGFSRGTGLGSGDDTFSVTLNVNDQLKTNINGVGDETITLSSGTDLDPRFVARDIEFKLHSANSDEAYKFAQCNWRNGGGGTNADNSFIIFSGRLGNNGGSNDVNITSPGSRDARTTLGFDTVVEQAGIDFATTFPTSTYTGAVTVSGSYGGQFDDFYTIMIAEAETVANPTAGGGNTYTGTSSTGGLYTDTSDDTYTVTIDTTNGSTMGAGSGNVPV